MTPAERLASRIKRVADGCWIWQGSVGSQGYGQLRVNGRVVGAHVFAYSTLVGPVLEGSQLDHLCRVRLCCNPSHLEPVTQTENVLRGVGPTAVNARKAACIRGHEFTPANTYISSTGSRQCRECNCARSAACKLRKAVPA